jgi:hypothetical protein
MHVVVVDVRLNANSTTPLESITHNVGAEQNCS